MLADPRLDAALQACGSALADLDAADRTVVIAALMAEATAVYLTMPRPGPADESKLPDGP